MPAASSPSTSKRLLALLSLLQSRRDWPARVLADRLEVTERTVRRDIDRLRELDYRIDATRGPDGGYRLAPGAQLPPLMFDDEQAIAIALTLRTALALGAGIEDAADRALRTISRLMPSRLAQRVENLALTTAAVPQSQGTYADPAVLFRIGETIRAREELRFDYDSSARSADISPALHPVRRVQPHHLLLRSGRWYLVGFSPERDDWRIYRADRITPRAHNGARFTPRVVPGGDPARFLSARFKGSGAADAWPFWGEATLQGTIESIAPYLGDGTVEAIDLASCRVRLGSWSWGALAATLARFEVEISAVEPAELRGAFAALGRRAVLAAR